MFVDRPPLAIDADCVLSEDREGAERAVSHLLAHGHRRIAFIGYPPQRHTASERLAGYRAALGGSEEIVRFCEHADEARALTIELLTGPEPPTALFSTQNLITIEVLRALYELRLQHEVALVGFDDILFAASRGPRGDGRRAGPAGHRPGGRRAAVLAPGRLHRPVTAGRAPHAADRARQRRAPASRETLTRATCVRELPARRPWGRRS